MCEEKEDAGKAGRAFRLHCRCDTYGRREGKKAAWGEDYQTAAKL